MSSEKTTDQQNERDQAVETVGAMQKLSKAQIAGRDLKDEAAKMTDPKERDRLLQEAYDKELEARGLTKTVERMQSGTWQGLAGGAGIGAGTGVGVGTLVGTLVGGLVSIPTTGLGALIGSGVGAIHGPWITIGGQKKRWDEAKPEEVVDTWEKEQHNGTQQGSGEQVGAGVDEAGGDQSNTASTVAATTKKKPRKLQNRSEGSNGPTSSNATGVSKEPKPSRKPKKLQVRSQPANS